MNIYEKMRVILKTKRSNIGVHFIIAMTKITFRIPGKGKDKLALGIWTCKIPKLNYLKKF